MDAETREEHVKVVYSQTIKAVTHAPLHWYESAVIEILFDLDEKYDGNIEKVVEEFWIIADNMINDYDDNGRRDFDDIYPMEWMEPGVAYSMGPDGWESDDRPELQY